jgi:hypothetical protein
VKTLASPEYKAEILRRLETVRPDAPRRWGRMSAHQMVCHLHDSFLAVTGRRSASPATGLFQRTVLKWLALYAPLRWPPGVRTRPEIDQEIGGTPPGDFARDVADLELMVGLITSEPACFDGQVHPIFGRMTHGDWMRWAYLHMDHHLRQFGA